MKKSGRVGKKKVEVWLWWQWKWKWGWKEEEERKRWTFENGRKEEKNECGVCEVRELCSILFPPFFDVIRFAVCLFCFFSFVL